MPQVIAGIQLGPNIYIFRESGDPNASADPLVQNAGIGSLYLQLDGADSDHVLWVCTAVATGITPATWTNK